MRHDGDKRSRIFATVARDIGFDLVTKHPEIIGADRRRAAEIMHRQIGQQRDRFAIDTLETDHRQVRIFRA